LSSASDRPSSRVLVLACTYNELGSLPNLVQSIRTTLPSADILVVDDGSPDGTGDWVQSQISQSRDQLHLIQRGGKRGLGTAIKAGLAFAIEHQYEFVVNLDADFSHDPLVIPSLIEASIEASSDLTIGSRYVSGGGLKNCSWRRHFVSRAANVCARSLVGWKIRDCSSAYRCYRVAFLAQLNLNEITCVGYGFLEEILWAILKNSGRVIERPIVYTEREHGESKISAREAIGALKILVHLARRGRLK
jgi:dolichol-phosphate mannosyltransferase